MNVATPTAAHDATTKDYVDGLHTAVSTDVRNLGRRVDNLGAMQMAVVNAQIPIPEGHSSTIGVGVGSYNGTQATSLAMAHRLPGNFQFSGNLAIGNSGEKAGGMGIGYTF